MTNYREYLLTKLREQYLKADTIKKQKIVEVAELVKTTGDEIKLRQLYLKLFMVSGSQLDINGGEVNLEPAAVKAKEMTMEEIKLAFDSPR